MKKYKLVDGVAPSLQLKEKRRGNPRIGYLPHCGAKQRAKALKALAKAEAKANAN